MLDKTVCELVREAEQNDSRDTVISKYVKHNMRSTLDRIDAYLNSKHISGEVDEQGREKPFFNIVKAVVNIWDRATDIDRKHIRIKADKNGNVVLSYIATILLQKWMRKNIWGRFLNQWGRSSARYNTSIIKFVEKDGKLYSEVKPWSKMLVDQVDFYGNPQIEKIEMTPAQLRKEKKYDQELVMKLLDDIETRKTPEGQGKDEKDDYITLWEVHGELELSRLTDNESDDDTYRQQMHVVTFLDKKDGIEGEYDDYTLYKGREAKSPYMKTDLIEEEGRTLAISCVEDMFDSQWMVNHNAKNIKDHLDLASKMIFQTSDGSFIGQNALSAIEQGDILVHKLNQPLTQLNNRADTEAHQANAEQWQRLKNELVGVSEAMLGEAPKSGTAWRQTRAILNESHSLFEKMRENKGLAIEEMLREYVIPNLKKKMDTSEEISEILEDYQIKQIDAMYVPNEAVRRSNQKIIDTVLSGGEFTREEQMIDIERETEKLQTAMDKLGNQRFIKPSDISTKTWKEALKDFEWDVVVDVTGEPEDTEAMMETLATAFQIIGHNPMVLEHPKAKLIFNEILSLAGGINPLEIDAVSLAPVSPAAQPAQPKPTAPVISGVGAGEPAPAM